MRLAYLVVALAGLGCLLAGCPDETFFQPDGAGFEDSYLPSWDSNNSGVPTPTCPGQEATVTGTALAPNGADPVPGASVFIPAKVPELFPPDVKCEVCGHLGNSNNLWYTTSAPNGSFTLKNVCPGKWPLVVQNGRFRRLVYITVAAGATMAVPAGQSRLPRRHKEFVQADSIPKIAVATGDFDKMECVLRKMGLADGTFDLYEAASSRKSPDPGQLQGPHRRPEQDEDLQHHLHQLHGQHLRERAGQPDHAQEPRRLRQRRRSALRHRLDL